MPALPAAGVVGFVVSDVMVVVLIAAGAAGVILDRPALTALGALVLVLTLVSRIWARHALDDLDYRLEVSSVRAMQGDRIQLSLVIENAKWLPVAWLRVREHIPEGLDVVGQALSSATGALGGSTVVLGTTALGPNERVRLRLELEARARGRYVLGPARLTASDPFGFYEVERVVAQASSTLLVLPRMPALPPQVMRLVRPLGERARVAPGPQDPTLPVTVRDHVEGDALASVDWKATARRGALQVRVNAVSMNAGVALLLECDTRRTGIWDASPRRLEQLVRITAALARDLLGAGHPVGLLANGIPPSDHARIALTPGAGPAQLGLLLEALARVQPVVVRPLHDLLNEQGRRVLAAGTAVVCIASTLRPETEAALLALSRQGVAVSVIDVNDTDRERTPAGLKTIRLDPALAGDDA